MKLSKDERQALVTLRIENAKETLRDAQIIADSKLWKASANRLYYACFYAANALMVHFGFEAKSHSGIIRLLGLHFITTNLIASELGDMYYKLYALRQKGDYDDWVVVKESDILPIIEPAKQFIETIENLINKDKT